MIDVVAELDAHIHDASNSVDYVIEWRRTLLIGVLQRARDEIVALREMREAHIRMLRANLNDVRDQTLDEAARVCEGGGAIVAEARLCASAIRALKGTAR